MLLGVVFYVSAVKPTIEDRVESSCFELKCGLYNESDKL